TSELLLETFRGFERRTRLFGELAGVSIADSLSSIGFRRFYEDWFRVVRARNSFVHARLGESPAPTGRTNPGGAKPLLPSVESLDRLAEVQLAAFAELRTYVKKRLDPAPRPWSP
ncbi:MAG: hypothetical protein ACREUU_11190, partial [Gammaproteobacteria bacterium]